MLAIAPGRVRWSAAAPGDTRDLADLLPRLQAEGVRSVSANGVLGDPRRADPAEGRELVRRAAADLVDTVVALQGGQDERVGSEVQV
jgi:creatinine amidohydrolase